MITSSNNHYKTKLSIAIIIIIIGIVFINKLPYFPGDIIVTNTIQRILPTNIRWAILLTKLAEFPTYFILFNNTNYFIRLYMSKCSCCNIGFI